jgi:multidrug efflux pump subunit AcrA (membrane-fusion protein)
MNRRHPRRSSRPWHLYLFGVIAIVVVALGIGELGTPASSARTSTELVTAADGVVQTTVSGTGNVEPSTDDDVNFATSGTLKSVDVKVGQRVKKGQLIATLDSSSARLTLQQAQATLTAAEDNLTATENGQSTSSSSGTGNNGVSASAAAVSTTEEVSYSKGSSSTSTDTTTTPTTTTTTPTTTGTTPTTTGTTPTTTGTTPTTTGTD